MLVALDLIISKFISPMHIVHSVLSHCNCCGSLPRQRPCLVSRTAMPELMETGRTLESTPLWNSLQPTIEGNWQIPQPPPSGYPFGEVSVAPKYGKQQTYCWRPSVLSYFPFPFSETTSQINCYYLPQGWTQERHSVQCNPFTHAHRLRHLWTYLKHFTWDLREPTIISWASCTYLLWQTLWKMSLILEEISVLYLMLIVENIRIKAQTRDPPASDSKWIAQ